MAPNPRVAQAFSAMKALGISAEEVKPVLAELLRVYDRNWELIEEDNYRTLVDAYFDFKDDKGTDAKKKASVNFHARERSKQKLHLIDDDDDEDQVLTTRNKPSQKLSVSNRKTPPGTSMQDSRPRTSSEASHARLMNVERVSNSPCKAAKSAGHSVDYEKELVKPRTKKPKLQTQHISTNHNGLSHASSSCNNNATTSTGNITIASSAQGEVKLSLKCNAALAQPNFCNPSLDTVMNFMEEKYLTACKTQDPQFSMVKLLDGLCRSYLMLGHQKRSNFKSSSSSNLAVTQDERSSSHFISDITRGSEKATVFLHHYLVHVPVKLVVSLHTLLKVYMTREGKGWGLRTLEDLPKGTFVCEYVGEILTNTELYERIVQSSCSNDRHTYPVTLDADWGSEGVLKDEEALCLDATYNGNVGRFINHRCFDANLIDIPVEVETPDHHYYHLAFFTAKNVRANEELTWDYGIDFDDHDHPIKAFQCSCGSAFCGDKNRKGEGKVENQVHASTRISA
ncbi:hypothetical protein PIB30_007098 [Stylosanthes scabra]|uniref:SET domain-containing protein n=1 Tax=Stylosanthes scabra TaxID=79078 RepID=A0ABU6S3W9_9FABA|nr:hypothetical protein [Stylosanthes scabra]